ncbi:MAG: hypothetical protein NTZ78_08345 [Candidatus Aureabacteria bacterium]|nr:hypothetical protein [Candidatus Auribacterota bacterium]
MKILTGVCLIGLCLTLVCGCRSLGPSALRSTYPQYNDVLARSLNQEFLLNLVRQKYRDTPFFLDVTSITSSETMMGKANVSADLLIDPFSGSIIKPGLEGTYSQTPTLSYAPVQGEDFLKKLMSPIPLSTLVLLTQSGGSIPRVFTLCIERINDIDNAARASLLLPEWIPHPEKFQRLVDLMGQLQRADLIEFGRTSAGKEAEFLLHIKESGEYADKVKEIKELLGVPAARNSFILSTDRVEGSGDRLVVRTRPVLGVLAFLAHGVDVPPEDLKAGFVTVVRNSDGSEYDWSKVTGKVIHIYSSKKEPANAYVAVRYRGSWFYLRDDDQNSKATFYTLYLLFRLQEAQPSQSLPVLTIPVIR